MTNNPRIHPRIKTVSTLVIAALMAAIAILALAGCGESPDTSAPERTVIDRTRDWQGALLYIADANGPVPEWGSVRIYDNVSGFVEKSVEQSVAASPVDVYVTPDGGSMYVAGSGNGRLDKFRWDGNNWIRAGVTIETPATRITSMAPGPDGRLYVTADDGGSAGKIYAVNLGSDSVEGSPQSLPDLADLRGIAWSQDKSVVYLCGVTAKGSARLIAAAWPSLAVRNQVDLQGATAANHPLLSADGLLIYVTGSGSIYRVDTSSLSVTGSFAPSGNPATNYSGSALSADGRSMFAAGKSAGEESTLYILDLASGSTVKAVKHISDTAGGIQRVE
ncbi:MAG: WD40 repeat domain-containing protein [Actinobacteria bacterium]|nr:WD40 repeat domain-containing protein [Actinomycetota bacterium]MCL5883545.1 WD40 repeat domain-containing protein [Actinomycetota bacterium]